MSRLPARINDLACYPQDAEPRTRAFECVLAGVFEALEERVPEIEWHLDRHDLRIWSRAVVIQGHPSRHRAPLWDITPLRQAWGQAAYADPRAWQAWQQAVARLEPWVRTPLDVALVTARIHARARQAQAGLGATGT